MSKKNNNEVNDTCLSEEDKKDRRFNIFVFVLLIAFSIGLVVFYFVYFSNEANHYGSEVTTSEEKTSNFIGYKDIATWYDFTDLMVESDFIDGMQVDYVTNLGTPQKIEDNLKILVFYNEKDAKKYFKYRKSRTYVDDSTKTYFEGTRDEEGKEECIFVLKDNLVIFFNSFDVNEDADFTYDEVRDFIYEDFCE